jgi:hypothetical protein
MHDEHDVGPPERADRPSRVPPAVGPKSADEGARLIALTSEVARRLQGACRGMSPAAFDALVREIALTKWRWEVRRRYGSG